jgi:hypothetical protein
MPLRSACLCARRRHPTGAETACCTTPARSCPASERPRPRGCGALGRKLQKRAMAPESPSRARPRTRTLAQVRLPYTWHGSLQTSSNRGLPARVDGVAGPVRSPLYVPSCITVSGVNVPVRTVSDSEVNKRKTHNSKRRKRVGPAVEMARSRQTKEQRAFHSVWVPRQLLGRCALCTRRPSCLRVLAYPQAVRVASAQDSL